MLVAFLSDLHANLPASRAAFASAAARGATLGVVAGDVVGDGPHPGEVIDLLRSSGIVAIRGNVDRKVLEADRAEDAGDAPAPNRLWTARQLSAVQREWLSALEAEAELRLGGARIRIVHGSPVSDTDYIYPSITVVGLGSKLQGEEPDVLVCGHSHVPFARRVGRCLVLNCGSAGRPADGDPRGSYALLRLEAGEPPRGAIVRFPYAVEEVMVAIREREVPGVQPDEYRRGVKL